MAEPHVISALRKKRAELAGEVVTAQLRLGKLRDDLDAVDRTLRVFDPRQHPEKIRPVVKRKGDRMFGYGECTRAILSALRDAPEPMTIDQVAERVALDCRIATESPGIAATLRWRVKAALTKLGKRGVVSGSGKPMQWSTRRLDES
jgi:hypothetical protein